MIAVLVNSMVNAAPDMGYFMIIFIILLWSFSLSGFVAFQLDMAVCESAVGGQPDVRQSYRTLMQSFFSVVRGINGDMSVQDLSSVNRIFGDLRNAPDVF